MDQVSTDRVCVYAAEDADIAWRLRGVLERQLVDPELTSLFRNVEMPLLEVLARMEFHGVAVDTHFLHQLSNQLAEQKKRFEGIDPEQVRKLAEEKQRLEESQQLKLGEVEIDLARQTAVRARREIHLTAKEFAMLRLLATFAQHLSLISNQLLVQQVNAEPPIITKAKAFILAHQADDISLGSVARAWAKNSLRAARARAYANNSRKSARPRSPSPCCTGDT